MMAFVVGGVNRSLLESRSSATLRILRGRRPSGVNSFHATPIGVVLKSKNIGWDVSHPSHPVTEPMLESADPGMLP